MTDKTRVKTLFFSICLSLITICFAREAELFVEMENIKNEVQVRGYSDTIHDKILRLYENNKNTLNSLENPSLKRELIGLVRSSVIVKKLKECVDTGHEKINKGIDALFIAAASSDCLGQVFSNETIEELSSDADSILDVVKNDNYNVEDLRKDLFEQSLPSLMDSFNRSRSKFKDTDPKFLASANELFPMLPERKRALNESNGDSALTYKESSTEVLGPIQDLYEATYGDRAQAALSDRWKEVYTPGNEGEDVNAPHLYGSGYQNRGSQEVENEIQNCLSRVNEIKSLQERASQHFSQLQSKSFQMGLSGIISQDEKMNESYEELGFSSEPQCITLKNGFSGVTPNMDRYGRALDSESLERGVAEQIEIEGSHVVMSLGNLGSDPNNVYTPHGRETLDTRSYLDAYTENGIKESHTKSLEGMVGFINHMGRRVYGTESESTTENLLNLAGDAAQSLTSLGDSKEVDIALLLMANPKAGMNSLITNPMALSAFCDSFKALRNQENVNTAIEIASALSMFTGVGGMMVKGTGVLAKGLRVSNLALAGADTVSILDSMTHARDLALANACEEGDESLCQSYLDSDRNMTLAVAGLALAGMGSVSGATKLTSRLRSAFLLRNGDNANGLIRDNQKIADLLSKANESQKASLMKILSTNRHSDEEITKVISLLQNNENSKTLEFLTQFERLDDQKKALFVQRLIDKANELEGGVCRIPS